jgi:hypothetical protein
LKNMIGEDIAPYLSASVVDAFRSPKIFLAGNNDQFRCGLVIPVHEADPDRLIAALYAGLRVWQGFDSGRRDYDLALVALTHMRSSQMIA